MAKRKGSDFRQKLLIRETVTPKQAFRDLRNYLAGRFVGATRDDVLLEEILKCLFCKLYLETSTAKAPPPSSGDTFATAEFYRGIFAKVRKDNPDIYSSTTELLLDPNTLTHVIESLPFSLVDATADPIGDAFEVFAGAESRERAGQFFTPTNATEVLVRAVDTNPGELVIDPACGAAGFLATFLHR